MHPCDYPVCISTCLHPTNQATPSPRREAVSLLISRHHLPRGVRRADRDYYYGRRRVRGSRHDSIHQNWDYYYGRRRGRGSRHDSIHQNRDYYYGSFLCGLKLRRHRPQRREAFVAPPRGRKPCTASSRVRAIFPGGGRGAEPPAGPQRGEAAACPPPRSGWSPPPKTPTGPGSSSEGSP